MSGMRPTGKLHLGHYFGVLTNWRDLQEEYECFFGIADWHALTTKFNCTENLSQNVLDVALDWLCAGIDPNVSTIYLQSLVGETAQLHVYLSMTTPQRWVERDPTLKDMVKMLRSGDCPDEISYGLMGYPTLMTADIMTFNAELVPVGSDQIAHLEISRDIVRRFNNIYGSNFNEPQPKLTQIPLLKGLDGQKMGKSFNNDIKISDTPEDTAKKVMGAITDRSRIKRTDPGNPDSCEVAWDYWKIFCNDLEAREKACRAGEIGCVECKRELAQKINDTLAPIRNRREEFARTPDTARQIIHDGSKRASEKAKEVLKEVKAAVRVFE
jgi:tryptophanyl-tRNA synthetase